MKNTQTIITGNNSNIIKSNNNSNILAFKNISLPRINDIIEVKPQPGDLVTCPDGHQTIVYENGEYYCDIDPNGDGLRPGTFVTCANGLTSEVDRRGNYNCGATGLAEGSIVTCISGITSVVTNGMYDCSQGDSDDIRSYVTFAILDTSNGAYIRLERYTYNNTSKEYNSELIDTGVPFTLDLNDTDGNLNQYLDVTVRIPINYPEGLILKLADGPNFLRSFTAQYSIFFDLLFF